MVSTAEVVEIKNPVTKNIKPRGTSGTTIYGGYFSEEYIQSLLSETGICTFDEMRRSDGQIKMLLSVIKNPIKSATWAVQPCGDEDIDKEISDFVQHVLFEDIGTLTGTKTKPFREFVTEALTMIEFGHVVFEPVHKMVRGHKTYGDYVGLSDIGFRHQRSLRAWDLDSDGAIRSIEQCVDGDLDIDVKLDGQNLLVISMEKEGDNYEGISMLRPCFGSWYRKNLYRKLQGIGIERASKGVPIGEVPIEAAQDSDIEDTLEAFQDVLDKLGAHETNGIVLPAGYSIGELKISHDAEKVQKVIDSENMEMAKAFLANFMELGGSGNGGSYALGSDLSDIFLTGIQYIADEIAGKITREIIPTLVRAKFGDQDKYPCMKVTGINDKAGRELSEIVKDLIGVGGMQASTKLQKFMHQRYKISEIDEELAEIQDAAQKNPEPPAPENEADVKKKLSDHYCNEYQLSEKSRKAFPVSAFIEDQAAVLNDLMQTNLRINADKMISDVGAIINRGGRNVRKKVLSTTMPTSKAYNTALREFTSSTIDETFTATIKEVGLDKKDVKFADALSKAPKKLRDKLISLMLLTAGVQDADIEKAVYFTFNANFETLTDEALIAEIKRQVDAYFAKRVIQTSSVNVASSIVNSTRRETFLMPEVFDEIESFIYNNPDPKSLICEELTGRVFSKDEFEETAFDPPNHHNCKSFISVQAVDDATKKPTTNLQITGSPEEKAKILRSKTL